MDQPYNFQTSGPIIDADRSLYIEREEDRHLLNLLRGEEMAYVNLLGPPQIGKTSLFYHLCCGLPEGYVPVMVNLCAASDAAEPQWYAYLCRRMLAQLDIDLDEDQQASLAQTSNKLGFLDFLERVSSHLRPQTRVIVMLDEFGTIPENVAEGFFGVLRTVFSDRGILPEFQKYAFILAGLMTTHDSFPLEWVGSPFNVGQKIYLSDLSRQGTCRLLDNLEHMGVGFDGREQVLERIYSLSGGHPNLVQKLCVLLAKMKKNAISSADVDQAAERLIVEGDDNIHWILHHLAQNKVSKKIVQKILDGGQSPFDRSDTLLRRLELIGILKEVKGQYAIRNQIYERVLRNFPALSSAAL